MKETIIQFGEGNFLRGFVDYFIHCLNKKGLYDGKVVLVQPIAVGMIEGLKAQDYKYNLFLRGIIPQIGLDTAIVTYERHERVAGESKYPFCLISHS
mgnify:CR=1 FL=1